MKPTVAFYTHLTVDYPDLLAEFRSRREEVRLLLVAESGVEHPGAKTVDLKTALAEAEVLVAPPLSREELDRTEKLKLHIIPFAGVNRAPLSWYREHNVLLASSHGNAPAVAERAVALALAAAGRIVEFDRDLRRGEWHRNRSESNPFDFWRSLRGAKTTILGAGAIGRESARLLRPLVGSITAVRRSPRTETPEPFDRVTTNIGEGMTGTGLVIAALPLTTETRGILRRNHFDAADRPVFVNVSRAEIIEEETLFALLTEKIVSAAGLDVWYRYPDPFWGPQVPNRFSQLDNVVLSPHAGSHAEEGKVGQLRGALTILAEYLSTGGVAERVRPEVGY